MNCLTHRIIALAFIFLIFITVSIPFVHSNMIQDKRGEIFNDIYSIIETTYCKNSKHNVVKIYIENFSCSNCNNEKEVALNKFFKDYLIEKFQRTETCVKLVSQYDQDHHFTINGGIYDRSYRNQDYPITVSISVEESLKNAIFFGERYNFNADNFNQKDYEKLKHRYSKLGTNKSNTPVITIKAVNQGDTYKEEDKFFLRTIYGFGWIDEQIFKKDTGFSGYYPANQQIEINGKKFEMNSDKEFFHGNITPGIYEIIAKFNETFWDAYNRQQNIRREKNKKFKIAVNFNDNLEIKIYFIYDGKTSDIQVQAFRIKQVEVGHSIEEVREVIEVYY